MYICIYIYIYICTHICTHVFCIHMCIAAYLHITCNIIHSMWRMKTHTSHSLGLYYVRAAPQHVLFIVWANNDLSNNYTFPNIN